MDDLSRSNASVEQSSPVNTWSICTFFTSDRPMIEQERKKLIESGAQRAKILSSTKQEIDTLFFDRRLSTRDGETLFITSEGNAGFMEIGSFATVSKSSFSVLGYNHPGMM